MFSAYLWWKSQKIVGSGVPDTVIPQRSWKIPPFSLAGPYTIPNKSLRIGPAYLSGDCSSTGVAFRMPWVAFWSLAGLIWNICVVLATLVSDQKSNTADYFWLVGICFCNLAPFFVLGKLFDTRYECATAFRPLLSSRALGTGGVTVEVVGENDDPVVVSLRAFLKTIGHLFKPKKRDFILATCDVCDEDHNATQYCLGCKQSLCADEAARHRTSRATSKHRLVPGGSALVYPACQVCTDRHDSAVFCVQCREHMCSQGAFSHQRWTATGQHTLIPAQKGENQNLVGDCKIQVHVMSTMDHRDALFGSDDLPFDPRCTMFVWTGKGDPFSKDATGTRMMRTSRGGGSRQ